MKPPLKCYNDYFVDKAHTNTNYILLLTSCQSLNSNKNLESIPLYN